MASQQVANMAQVPAQVAMPMTHYPYAQNVLPVNPKSCGPMAAQPYFVSKPEYNMLPQGQAIVSPSEAGLSGTPGKKRALQPEIASPVLKKSRTKKEMSVPTQTPFPKTEPHVPMPARVMNTLGGPAERPAMLKVSPSNLPSSFKALTIRQSETNGKCFEILRPIDVKGAKINKRKCKLHSLGPSTAATDKRKQREKQDPSLCPLCLCHFVPPETQCSETGCSRKVPIVCRNDYMRSHMFNVHGIKLQDYEKDKGSKPRAKSLVSFAGVLQHSQDTSECAYIYECRLNVGDKPKYARMLLCRGVHWPRCEKNLYIRSITQHVSVEECVHGLTDQNGQDVPASMIQLTITESTNPSACSLQTRIAERGLLFVSRQDLATLQALSMTHAWLDSQPFACPWANGQPADYDSSTDVDEPHGAYETVRPAVTAVAASPMYGVPQFGRNVPDELFMGYPPGSAGGSVYNTPIASYVQPVPVMTPQGMVFVNPYSGRVFAAPARPAPQTPIPLEQPHPSNPSNGQPKPPSHIDILCQIALESYQPRPVKGVDNPDRKPKLLAVNPLAPTYAASVQGSR